MFDDTGRAEVWSWSEASGEWQHVGYHAGEAQASSSQRGTLNGEEFDFVFDVDIDQGAPLKLGYNHGDDVWHVAQQFIWKHQLDQGALQTIAEFIQTNAGVGSAPSPAASGNVDPLTRTRELPDVLPVRAPILFTNGNSKPAPIFAKVCMWLLSRNVSYELKTLCATQ
jgi:hypothetical protein